MRILEGINFFLSTYGRLIVGLFNVRLWPPYLIVLGLMLALLFACVNMWSGLFAGWIIPLMTFASSDAVLHYPQHMALLPLVFERLNLIISLLVESVLTAAAVLMFVAFWRREKISFMESLKAAFKQYFKLLIVWIVVFILIYLLFMWLPELFRRWVEGSPRRMAALSMGMQGLSALLRSLFIYVIPFLMISRRGLGGSFTGSFRMFFGNFFMTLFLVGIPQIFVLPLVYALQNTGTIVSKFNPDILIWMTALLAVILTLVNFFTTGAIVRFFLQTAEE